MVIYISVSTNILLVIFTSLYLRSGKSR